MTASRPKNAAFYDKAVKMYNLGDGFPHRLPIHSGVYILNHKTNEVKWVIEGFPNKEGELFLDINRETTLAKLQNTTIPKNKMCPKETVGFWKQAYQIETYQLDAAPKIAKEKMMKFYVQFNLEAKTTPVKYKAGSTDCQTCVHYMLHQILGHSVPTPHRKDSQGAWGDGSLSPHEVQQKLLQDNTENTPKLNNN